MSNQDINKQLESIYGFAMPESFFAFWDFVNRATPESLSEATGIIALMGPFDLLRENAPKERGPIWQARYYHDPPEFLTVLAADIDGHHWGYYVDEPGQADLPVAGYFHSDSVEMTHDGADLFEAVRMHLEGCYQDQLDYLDSDAASADAYQAKIARQEALRTLLQQYGTADRPEQGWDYQERYLSPRLRDPIAPTRDNMGIVVPPESYRELVRLPSGRFGILDPEADPEAEFSAAFPGENYFPSAAEAQEMTDAALQALSDGFPGTALKLGKDLWTCGRVCHDCSYRLLEAAYEALKRPLLRRYLDIAREHRAWCDAGGPRREYGIDAS